MGDPIDVDAVLYGLMDELAAIEHERWSHWQRYMHSKGVRQADGSLVLATDYHDLSAKEKQSDRDQVSRYLPLIATALNARS